MVGPGAYRPFIGATLKGGSGVDSGERAARSGGYRIPQATAEPQDISVLSKSCCGRSLNCHKAVIWRMSVKWMLPSPRWPKQETREPGSTASPAHAKRCEPGAIPHGSPAPRQHASKPRRSSATNNHGSTAGVERPVDSVEVLSRGPKSAVEAQNEVASILRY